MQIYPAIDLRAGHCVRLLKGNYNQQTTYSDDPLSTAHLYQQQGATWLHVVDLDGAKSPDENQRELICEMAKETKLSVQVGGGIRQADHIETLLQAGVTRVIIGSTAVTNPMLVKEWLQEFGPQRIVLAFDVKLEKQQAYVCTHAWQETSQTRLSDIIADYQQQNLQHILVTDIDQDGTLEGPNLALYQQIKTDYPRIEIQASGGVGQLDDVVQLKENHIDGVIIGKALYENRFTLTKALAC